MTGLLQDSHELENRKGPADLQVREPAVQPAKDAGEVTANVRTLNRCRLRLRFRAWTNISLGACRTLKDLDLRVIVGYSSKSMISYMVLPGYEGKESGAKVEKIWVESVILGYMGMCGGWEFRTN
jgi:hypothetical protein